jgi:hypothetical protein
MECKHDKSTAVSSYCHGFNEKPNGIECLDIRKCEKCGHMWREQHTGHYVQDTESKVVDSTKEDKAISFVLPGDHRYVEGGNNTYTPDELEKMKQGVEK